MSPIDQQRSHIFVSPHFDDGVLSCGGTIKHLTDCGHSVTVLTTMGGTNDGVFPKSPILQELHQRWKAGDDPLRRRQQEDVLALRSLGANHLHYCLTDCIYRQAEGLAMYATEESLFGEVHALDYAGSCLRAIRNPLLDQGQAIYLPLAVGHHVDHQIVRDWGLDMLNENRDGPEIRFYAEYPYSNADQAIAQALSRIGKPLREFHALLSEPDIQAKVDAIACYRSQISTFWQSLVVMEADVRLSSRHPQAGHYLERYWVTD